MSDITNKADTETEQQESLQSLKTLVMNLPGMAYRGNNDAERTMIFASKGCAELIDLFPLHLTGKNRIPFIQLIHEEDRQIVLDTINSSLEKRQPYKLTYRIKTHLGKEKWVLEKGAGVFTPEGKVQSLVGFIMDITESKKAEEDKQRMEQQLLLSGRLAAVGELAAGVAHELNNPIAAIQAYAQLLTSMNSLEDTILNDLHTIYRESQRASRITSNLLSFARDNKPLKKLISINDAVEQSLELHVYRLRVNNIEVSTELDPNLPLTMADFHQLQQVFVNLITNAEQAMTEVHGQGNLMVKTENLGDTIKIFFSDNGPGIAEQYLDHIFDPFFTTKDVGKGTGLGLGICYGIIQEHGGQIYATSEVGKGATFIIEFPIVSESDSDSTPLELTADQEV